MHQREISPLTFRQRAFWLLAFSVLIVDALILILAVWPGPCGCGG